MKFGNIKILDVKELSPAKPYAGMEDYGETKRFKVFTEVDNEIRNYIVYEFLEENKESICYVLNGYCNRLNDNRNKDFYYDQHGVFFSAWGISWKRESRHKFDEEEVKKIAKITGFNYIQRTKKKFVFYVHQKREPLLLESRINEKLLRKLILGWLACWELI